MKGMPGIAKPGLQALPQIEDRMTFLYLEHCQLNRQDGAIAVKDAEGVVYVPASAISVLLLGPGTSLTHRAMELIGDAGVTIIWVGEHGVRYYASGRSLTHRAGLLQKQAELVSNQRKHLDVVRKMYAMRFPGEDVSQLTLQQLRGREGARVRAAYKRAAEQWGVSWNGRVYDPNDFGSSDLVNQALSAGHQCLYGLAHAVIAALGCSSGLGFVHVGHENSFVYDVADLYKADITIPLAFEVASRETDDIGARIRRRTRDKMTELHLLERMVKDIRYLLADTVSKPEEGEKQVFLWDGARGVVENGRSYAEQ